MTDVGAFLLTTVAVSLSGVIAPGPLTAATVAAGARRRHAGTQVALGHAVVEVPLIVLFVAGTGVWLQTPAVRIGLGLAGGALLILMGVPLLWSNKAPAVQNHAPAAQHPLLAGVVLTLANPYFLMWWATVGLSLTSQAYSFGTGALALLILVHWLCDLVWLETLSLASFSGSKLLGPRSQRLMLAACAVLLIGFGAKFLYDAGHQLF